MTGQSNQQQKQPNAPSHFRSTVGTESGSGSAGYTKGGIGNDDNDSDDSIIHLNQSNNSTDRNSRDTSIPTSTIGASSLLLPSIGVLLRVTLGATVALYILNQKHLLPYSISKVVSHVLFWPTLPITISKRLGKWYSPIDETVIMGGAPFGFAKIPELLYEQYDVRGVINLCEEYRGPDRSYKRLGMDHLHLPTTDHYEPSLKDIHKAIRFIKRYERRNEKVYVHCRAGHGRSAAIAYAWLLTKNPKVDLQQLNEELCQQRNVRKTLYQQPNILKFHSILLQRQSGAIYDDDDDEFDMDDGSEDEEDDNKYSGPGDADDDDDDDDDSQLYSFKNIEDEL